MSTTPRRTRQTNSHRDTGANTPGQSGQQDYPHTPINNNNSSYTNNNHDVYGARLRSSTRLGASAATASAGGNMSSITNNTPGIWSTNTSPNNSFTTPTRLTRQPSGTHNGSGGGGSGGGGGGGGGGEWSSLAGGGLGAASGSGGSGGPPGSASSTTSATPTTNPTSRHLRGPPLPNPHVTLKRGVGSSGSLSNSGSFNSAMAALTDMSPGPGAGSRTPSARARKPHQPSTISQSMRTIPSPFGNSPATLFESVTPMMSSISSSLAGPYGTAPASVGGSSARLKVPGADFFGPDTGSAGSRPPMQGKSREDPHGFFENNSTAIVLRDHFSPANTQRERGTVDSLRAWRTDAMHQHMYPTAAFWGDKVLSITDDPNDVFWLSQVYYLMGEYGRAIHLLQKKNLVESSVACRFLAIQCMIRTEKWADALEYLGEENQYAKDGSSENGVNSADGGIKLEASMCYLRGIVYKSMHNIDKAKECFKEALQIDVKCYDALDSLVFYNMLTNSEERELIESLEFSEQLHGPDAEFVKMLYQSKLKKYDHLEEQDEIYRVLNAKFKTENADLLHSKAEMYFTQCCFDKCLECTKRILEIDKFNLACIPLHLVSLYELSLKNELFLLAHELVDQHPKHAVTWFAVGVYYYMIGNLTEARRYFGKASTIDGHYGPAWIGFGHSFALEGEHDQAISAYATSAKLLQGSHLGHMYIGMQHLQQNNVILAQKYLTFCLTICDADPLLLSEIGVVHYNLGQYDEAVESFLKAIEKLKGYQRKNVIWETTWLNLAHTKYADAETYFLKVDGIAYSGATRASTQMGLGFVYQITNRASEAIECYHKVLAIRSGDQMASEMLQKVMEDKIHVEQMEWMTQYLPQEWHDDLVVERRLEANERTTRMNSAGSSGSGGGGGSGTGSGSGTGKRKGSLSRSIELLATTRSKSRKGKEVRVEPEEAPEDDRNRHEEEEGDNQADDSLKLDDI
ncbi:anaphase promoting complex subunit cdc16 [Mortierella claussenii]|nr:anaphase promoting complex subunit cdc16 [Mortierella claussenii]